MRSTGRITGVRKTRSPMKTRVMYGARNHAPTPTARNVTAAPTMSRIKSEPLRIEERGKKVDRDQQRDDARDDVGSHQRSSSRPRTYRKLRTPRTTRSPNIHR